MKGVPRLLRIQIKTCGSNKLSSCQLTKLTFFGGSADVFPLFPGLVRFNKSSGLVSGVIPSNTAVLRHLQVVRLGRVTLAN